MSHREFHPTRIPVSSPSFSGREEQISNTSHRIDRRKFMFKRIAPAIAGKSCPICLNHIDYRRAAVVTACMHAYCIDCIKQWSDLNRKCPLCNSHFDSWFYRFSFSSRTFCEQNLPPLYDEVKKIDGGDLRIVRSNRSTLERVLRLREDSNIGNGRTRPLPRLRSFGNPRVVPCDVIEARVLQWRKSIYEQHLQAVPCSNSERKGQDVTGTKGIKEMILQKIEPWIWRELQALTGDHDPSILVHVTTSIYIATLENKQNSSRHCDRVTEEDFLKPLRPFLFGRTNLFWHELRCFAESYLNMHNYDTVVRYVVGVG